MSPIQQQTLENASIERQMRQEHADKWFRHGYITKEEHTEQTAQIEEDYEQVVMSVIRYS